MAGWGAAAAPALSTRCLLHHCCLWNEEGRKQQLDLQHRGLAPLPAPEPCSRLTPGTPPQTGLTEDEFAELPYHLRRAALRDGMEGLLAAGFKPRRDAAAASGGQEAAEREADDAAWPPGVRGPSWRRQYVFVAATMPAEGEHTVGAEIAARFPAAAWLAGRQLHQSKRAVEHAWRRVEDDAHRAEVLRVSPLAGEAGAAGAGCWQEARGLSRRASCGPRAAAGCAPAAACPAAADACAHRPWTPRASTLLPPLRPGPGGQR